MSTSERTRCGALRRQPAAFAERLEDQLDAALLQVANAAVDEFGAAAGRALAEVVLLEQHHAISARGRIDRNAQARGTAADHERCPTGGCRRPTERVASHVDILRP